MKEQQQKKGNKKKVTSILSIVLVAALLLGGTYAWYDFSQEKDNVFKGDIDRTHYEVELGDDFDPDTWPDQEGEKHDKKIYATNKGEAPLYIRIRLDELLLLDDEIGTEKNYLTHLWTESASADDAVFHEYFKWFMGNDVKTVAEWKKAGKGNGAFWLLDEDGWCYWGEPLEAGEETSKLMEQVQLLKKYDGEYEYHINAILQAVSDDDLDKWLDGCEEDGKVFAPCTPAAKELLVGNPIVNEIKDKKPGEKITIDGNEWWIMSNDGEEAEILATQALFTHSYSGDKNLNTYTQWAYSDIRKFLNNTFFDSLDPDFQSVIKTVDKLTEAKYGEEPSVATKEQVYLLSLSEVVAYQKVLPIGVFKNRKNEENNPIDGGTVIASGDPAMTHANHVKCDDKFWILRSPASVEKNSSGVNGDKGTFSANGGVSAVDGFSVNYSHGIRPAVTIGLK